MGAGVFASRRSVVNLVIAACFVAVSCNDRESPTSPLSPASAGKATISGTLVSGDAPAGQPLANITVRVASTGQTAQTDAAGNFTLAGVMPGAVSLEIRGAGVQSSVTVNASATAVTKITVAVSGGHSTVSLSPRSDGIEGIVDSISAPSFVLRNSRRMVTIRTDTATKFRMDGTTIGFADLKVGQHAQAQGSPQPDGSVLAARVSVEGAENEETRTPTTTPSGTITPVTATPTRTPRPEGVDVEGAVGPITGTSFVLMTRSTPVTIQTDSATIFRRDESPATFADVKTGGRVEVKGARQADGSVLASRVDIEEDEDEDRTKTPTPTPTMTTTATTPLSTRTPTPTKTPEPEGVEREGSIASIIGTSFVLMTGSGPVMIQTTAATLFRRDGDTLTFGDLKVGNRAQAEGTLQADGSILASRVSLEGD